MNCSIVYPSLSLPLTPLPALHQKRQSALAASLPLSTHFIIVVVGYYSLLFCFPPYFEKIFIFIFISL